MSTPVNPLVGQPWWKTHLVIKYNKCNHTLNVEREDKGTYDHYGCQCTGCVDACLIVFDELCPCCRYRNEDCFSWRPVPVKFIEPQELPEIEAFLYRK